MSSATRRNAPLEIPVQPGDLLQLKTGKGALIGSFDGFKTSFSIGSTTTVTVPANADNLSLAVNDEGEAGKNYDGSTDVFIERKKPHR